MDQLSYPPNIMVHYAQGVLLDRSQLLTPSLSPFLLPFFFPSSHLSTETTVIIPRVKSHTENHTSYNTLHETMLAYSKFAVMALLASVLSTAANAIPHSPPLPIKPAGVDSTASRTASPPSTFFNLTATATTVIDPIESFKSQASSFSTQSLGSFKGVATSSVPEELDEVMKAASYAVISGPGPVVTALPAVVEYDGIAASSTNGSIVASSTTRTIHFASMAAYLNSTAAPVNRSSTLPSHHAHESQEYAAKRDTLPNETGKSTNPDSH